LTITIALALLILALAAVLLVSEWLPLEVTALLVLASVALTGLVTPQEALAGFSSPAVVTVWAVFILSGGLTRTGVANAIGQRLLRLAGVRESKLLVVVMLVAALMSAFMNNVAVAALLLPVVMDIARRTGHPPSRLLLPLAYGCLLGGLTTLIGTPPNILASDALRYAGLPPFRLFDYTPLGAAIMFAGIFFMALFGRHLLPKRDVARESAAAGHLDLSEQYELQKRMLLMRVPAGSELAGRTLAGSRLGAFLGLHVVEIIRGEQHQLAPGPASPLLPGDRLLVEGKLERMNALSGWRQLQIEGSGIEPHRLLSAAVTLVEAKIAAGSVLVGKTLNEVDVRNRFRGCALALRRGDETRTADHRDIPLQVGDLLLLQVAAEGLAALKGGADFASCRPLEAEALRSVFGRDLRLLGVRVPRVSILAGLSIGECHLGETSKLQIVAVDREDGTILAPETGETLHAGDRLIVQGGAEDLRILQGLLGLEVEREVKPGVNSLESEQIGLLEAVLSPRTTLAGKTLRHLNFREKYGLSVLAIWREGRAYRSDLREMALRFGDALLLYGPREKLLMLAREPDFLLLSAALQEVPRQEKRRLALLIMSGVLLPVILGLVPIYIVAVLGAALMVATRCLTMTEAYRAIEWKAVFLIAGLLPLGTALEHSGAAGLLARNVVALVGPYGPNAVVAGLLAITFLATCIIPTSALVILLAPIVLGTSEAMGMSPQALMMATAMAASSSFLTPISHPANVLVMGPGGYRFRDYLKVGLPLTLVVFCIILVFLPHLWPLTP